RTPDRRGRRPHGPTRREPAGRWPRVRTVPEVHATALERLVQGELPRATLAKRAAGAGRRTQGVSRCRPVRAPGGGRISGSRTVGYGLAASQSEGPHARRWPSGRLHPPHRDDARAAAQAAGRQPHAAVLAMSAEIIDAAMPQPKARRAWYRQLWVQVLVAM